MKRLARKKTVWLIIISLAFFITATAGIVFYSEWRLARLVPGGLGERFPTRVYSYPFVITNKSTFTLEEILDRLKRLDYHMVAQEPAHVGEIRWVSPQLTVAIKGFKTPSFLQDPNLIRMTQSSKGEWKVTSSSGAVLDQVALEPELMAELSGPKKVRREPTPWEDFPPALIDAVLSVEDRRFYKHHGIDLRAVLRAAWYNLRNRRNLQGGSTITQQLAKNFFLSQERTIQRKLLEAGFAVYLNFRYSKERILTLYLNHIYMGQDGVVSVAGMGAASQYYFGKPLRELSLSESALLAGIIRSPYRYNPFVNLKAAGERRDTVLRLMLEEEALTEPDYEIARKMPVLVRKHTQKSGENETDKDYFLAEVIRQLVPEFSEDILFRYGLKIYTTYDTMAQELVRRATKLEKSQSAMVVMEPSTGRVLALSGGKNFQESQFNRATQAHRQPGSAFKPFVYGAALENGYTPASILSDEPRAYRQGEKLWAPQNFDGVFHGNVSLRRALAYSMNGATLDLAQKIGPSVIMHFAKRMGVESPLENNLALALGVSEVTPIELIAAYAPFANGGFQVRPYLIVGVEDSEGNVLQLNTVERTSVLDPALSYLMTSLLQTTVSEGTAKKLMELGWDSPAAGKTGTTNDGRDAWFVGYTPDLLAGVWVGDDNAKAGHLAGAKNALPLWGSFMKNYYANRKTKDFEKPSGLTAIKIDPVSGLLARSGCPDQKEELFISGTQPATYCPIHSGGIKGWFIKHFGKKR